MHVFATKGQTSSLPGLCSLQVCAACHWKAGHQRFREEQVAEAVALLVAAAVRAKIS